MLVKNFDTHFKIVNLWLLFVLALVFISNLPHFPVPVHSWVNCSLYFLLFLQSAFMATKDSRNRAIFINVAAFAFLSSLDFAVILIGDDYLWGNDLLAFYVSEYRVILLSLLFAICTIFICVKYLFNHLDTLHIYVITLAIILPVFAWHYAPFLTDTQFLLEAEENLFEKKDLYFNLLPLTFVLLYSLLLYKYDRSLGQHINTLMIAFFLMNLTYAVDLIGYIYNIMVFSLSQYVLLVVLSLFLLTMFRLLNHAYSDFGQFYDEIVTAGNRYGVPIKRKKSLASSVIEFARAYFHERRNVVSFVALLLIVLINISDLSLFLRIDLAVVAFGGLVVFYYFTALTQKRLNNGDIISYNPTKTAEVHEYEY